MNAVCLTATEERFPRSISDTTLLYAPAKHGSRSGYYTVHQRCEGGINPACGSEKRRNAGTIERHTVCTRSERTNMSICQVRSGFFINR